MLRQEARLWWQVALNALMVALAACAAMPVFTFAAELVSEPRAVLGIGFGAGTLEGSLVLAYQNNPQLNAQRAATRATDENVTTALSGYRPRVTGTSSLTEQYIDQLIKTTTRLARQSIHRARVPQRHPHSA